MCNHYSSSGEWRDRMGEFAHLKLPVFDREGARPNVQTHVYPGRIGEILKVEGDKLAASAASWRLIPKWHRGSIKDSRSSGEAATTPGPKGSRRRACSRRAWATVA